MIRIALAVALLAGIYAALLGSTDPADLATGALAAVAVLAIAGQLRLGRQEPTGFIARIAWFFPWLAVIVRDIVSGTWDVARISLMPGRAPTAGVVAIPIGERSRQGVAVSALAATISPGELLVGVDWDRGVMLIHVLDATDPDAVRERHKRIYDRLQVRVFP